MEYIRLPSLVDAPMQIALWEIDDIGPIILMIGIGVATKSIISCFIVGLLLSKVYANFKLRTSRGAIMYFFFWNGLGSLGQCKNGLSRIYVGS